MGGGREGRALCSWRKSNPRTLFSPVPRGSCRGSFLPLVYSELSQTPYSPFLFQFFLLILTRCLLIGQPPDLASGPQLPQAMEIADSLLKVIVDTVEQRAKTPSPFKPWPRRAVAEKRNQFLWNHWLSCNTVLFLHPREVGKNGSGGLIARFFY